MSRTQEAALLARTFLAAALRHRDWSLVGRAADVHGLEREVAALLVGACEAATWRDVRQAYALLGGVWWDRPAEAESLALGGAEGGLA